MSISDPKVDAGCQTIDGRVVADAPKVASPPPASVEHDRNGTHALSPRHTIGDRELTLIQISCDFVCACIALPLSLLLLSRLSPASVNASGKLLTNMKLDSLFPVAVVLALAIGEFLHSTFGTVEPNATQLVMAVIVTIGVITVGHVIMR